MEYDKPLRELVKKAIKEKKAIAIGGAGKVNGKEFPMLEYDGIELSKAVGKGLFLQNKFDLNKFAVFQTKQGFHLRFYFDNELNHEKIKEIIDESGTNKEYSKIAKQKYCINRLTGKHKEKDIKFLGFYGFIKKMSKKQYTIGKSLLSLHLYLMDLKFKKELLLNGLV